MTPKVHPVVFSVSAMLTLVFVAVGAWYADNIGQIVERLQGFLVANVGWFYVLVVAFFLVFVLWLLISPYGALRLGKQEERPEYTNTTWFAMLFSAGMGIGLLFFSVAEPVMHFTSPPGADGATIDAAHEAMLLTFLHWGLHAWAIYIIIGLALAYFAYRHNLPLAIRSTLYPLLGHRINGPIGNVVETVAVLGTIFGVATSLGLGAMQINAGLDYLGLLSESTVSQLVLIALITAAATVSVASGLDRGIRRLSQLNLGLGVALVLFVLITGPTVFLASSFIESVGRYLQNIVALSLRTDAFFGTDWQADWTMFYWAWWISWSPFVGMFIARISRGRTVREFIAGVLLVPTLLTFLWLTVFGNTALHIELFGDGGIAGAVAESTPVALFALLEQLPLSAISITMATLVIATFFITSSDSGSLVIDILTSGGRRNRPVYQRVFWSLLQGGVAMVLLLAGGLLALQTAVLTLALPFSIVMLVICYSLVKGLRTERSDALAEPHAGSGLIKEPGEPVSGA
ncbi:MAG: BCCT family transporter [Dehalococcoidia bacterium]